MRVPFGGAIIGTDMRNLLAILCLIAGSALAAPPAFTDYPVLVEKVAHNARPKLIGKTEREYSSQIRDAMNADINFAGRFVFATWGCGAGCVMGAAVDAKTGKVTMLPFTVSDWPLDIQEPLVFKSNSQLLEIYGALNEKNAGHYFYKFTGSKFVRLSGQ